jgi:sortase (surface protein transpeptidase)
VLRTRAEAPARSVRVRVGIALAVLLVLAGTVGLIARQQARATSAPPASNIGVVSGASPTPSPAPTAAASDGSNTLSTHSTELGAQAANAAAPARVSIPRLHLSATPVPVGLAADGRSLGLLPSARTVVWWAYGAAPGASTGTVLLAGHISWAGHAGTLGQIGTLRVGDKVTLVRQDGVAVQYLVTGRRRVPKMSLSQLGLFATGGAPRLVLVTCGGQFNAVRHSYEDNVVIQAKPV